MTYREADRHTNKMSYRDIDRQTNIQTNTQTQTYRRKDYYECLSLNGLNLDEALQPGSKSKSIPTDRPTDNTDTERGRQTYKHTY